MIGIGEHAGRPLCAMVPESARGSALVWSWRTPSLTAGSVTRVTDVRRRLHLLGVPGSDRDPAKVGMYVFSTMTRSNLHIYRLLVC